MVRRHGFVVGRARSVALDGGGLHLLKLTLVPITRRFASGEGLEPDH